MLCDLRGEKRTEATFFAIPLFFLFLHELARWDDWRVLLMASSGIVFGACFGTACGYCARTPARAVMGYLAALAVWVAGGPIACVPLKETGWSWDLEEHLLSSSPVFALIGPRPFWCDVSVWVAPAIGCAASAAALYLSVTRLRRWIG